MAGLVTSVLAGSNLKQAWENLGLEEKQLKHLDPVLFPSSSPAQTLQCGWALTGGATNPEAQGRF